MDLLEIRKKLNYGIPISQIKLRVTDYARVSTDSLMQKNSLQNQVDYFNQLIKGNPNWTYVRGYADSGISGTNDLKRNAFMKMIDDAKKGKFDLIITKEISRFSRNTLDSIKYTRLLLDYGVAVLFVNDNINTAFADSELRLTIMASMAQDEIRRLSERVKFGMHEAIKKGSILGHNHLYGYIKNKITGNLEINEKEKKYVHMIFQLYANENYSLNKIARKLNQEKILTGQGNKWCTSTIMRMIKNPKYKGYYCGKKSEVIDYMSKKVKYYNEKDWVTYRDFDRIPPIVSEKLWVRANKKLKCKSHSQKNNYESELDIKIYCKKHGTLFYQRKQCTKTNDLTWMCKTYYTHGKKTCNSANIRKSEIEKIYDKFFLDANINEDNIIHYLKQIYDKKEKEILENKKYNLTIKKMLISYLTEKIVVEKLSNSHIVLDIYLFEKIECNKQKYYFEFIRNQSFKNLKPYLVIYEVNIYFI